MASSFSSAAKAEVCRILPQKHCCALAECFGVLLFANHFSADGIKIITESREFAYILPKLFKKAFDLPFDSYPSLASPGKLVFQIWDSDKIGTIMGAFGFDTQDTLALHVNLPVVEAAQEQLAAIRIIRETGAMDKLPEKLRRAAVAREENPSASLSELAGMMEPPITKPAMGSRMRRLLELAEEVKA